MNGRAFSKQSATREVPRSAFRHAFGGIASYEDVMAGMNEPVPITLKPPGSESVDWKVVGELVPVGGGTTPPKDEDPEDVGGGGRGGGGGSNPPAEDEESEEKSNKTLIILAVAAIVLYLIFNGND